ncbi:hypothetical protein PIB30_025142 [Stylosanthes scabra]|uniref:Uncharacterized protein n=1 Tax=Stylosanthes scabra TaxID=79078 RepID=A0ABU6X8T9_9FABA|nr:hypothetical protein [Stylosanthes scabra]
MSVGSAVTPEIIKAQSQERWVTLETLGDRDAHSLDFNGQICGPIAASLNESIDLADLVEIIHKVVKLMDNL